MASSSFACCIFHNISIPFYYSDTVLRVAEAMIGAKVKIFVFRHVQLCFSNLAPDIVPRIFGLFSILISEIGQKFLIRTQGEIHPGSCKEALAKRNREQWT